MKPAGFHAAMAGDGHQLGLGKAEAAPQGPGRPPHSRGTKPAAGSHQSSLTSLEGSGISEHLAQKSLRQAGGHLEVGVQGARAQPRELPAPRPLLTLFLLGMFAPVAASHNPAQQAGLRPNATSLPQPPPVLSLCQHFLFFPELAAPLAQLGDCSGLHALCVPREQGF